MQRHCFSHLSSASDGDDACHTVCGLRSVWYPVWDHRPDYPQNILPIFPVEERSDGSIHQRGSVGFTFVEEV